MVHSILFRMQLIRFPVFPKMECIIFDFLINPAPIILLKHSRSNKPERLFRVFNKIVFCIVLVNH